MSKTRPALSSTQRGRGKPSWIRAWKPGPGMLVTAAFVGPGTIATASAAGAGFGYALLWALLFSVVATMVLQEMSVRQAVVSGQGLSAMLRTALADSWLGRLTILLVIAAIGLGNAAYESGNIAGAALALDSVSAIPPQIWTLAIGAAAAVLLFLPVYRQLERVLIALVLLMSIVFVSSAVLLAPAWSEIATGLFVPSLPSGSITTVIALIGTTVVPYNLFLQANAVRDRWAAETDRNAALTAARRDTFLSVGLGGIVTLAILSAAAVTFFTQAEAFSSARLVTQLDPVLGSWGRYVFATGLFAAGLTSAVTAPLAAGYAVSGALGVDDSHRGKIFRIVALTVVLTGTFFATLGARPLSLILFAQAANGLLLPIIAAILLWLMNQHRYVKGAANGWASNLLGLCVLLITLGLGINKLMSLF
ncbi:MAG: Nramp family divalent metal transporter [Congregibacter sp.]